jgi:cyclohexanecarboxylate-CoA ligase
MDDGRPLQDAATMWELVERRAALTPDALALVDPDDRSLTFGELRDRAERVAAGLYAMGIGPGDEVTWQLPSRIETVLVSVALARLGVVQNPILHIYGEKEVSFALHQFAPKLYIGPGELFGVDYLAMAERVSADVASPPLVISGYADLPEGDPSTLPSAPTNGDEVRWLYYTSGTTSDPKGVQHTDRTLIAGGYGLAHAVEWDPGIDVGSIAFPFAHIAGPDYLVLMLITGVPAVIIEGFDLEAALPVFRKHDVTSAGGSTAHYLMFLAEQRKDPSTPILPSLRMLAGGGAPKPPEIFYEVKRELDCIGTLHGYGMTECPMIAQGSPSDSEDQLAHSEGKPVVGCDVRIVGEDGHLCGPGEDGEVRLQGPMLFKGYTDPALDADAFDEDGYFRTGDVGHLRADGHIVLTGRLKDIIIRKGENISAKEIEDVLYTHPKVGDVAVIGVPDRERGEMVCAVVETAPGAEALSFDEMAAYCRDAGLMIQKTPERLEVVDALPRNQTLNKILKYKLREQYG